MAKAPPAPSHDRTRPARPTLQEIDMTRWLHRFEPVLSPLTRRARIASGALLLAVLASCTSTPTAIPPQSTAQGKVVVQWLGQAAFKITTVTGKVIVIDPYLTANPKTPEQYKKLEALGKVDLILVTHGHVDHFLDAPALAKMHNAPVWAPAGLSQSLQTLGILPVPQANRMNLGGSIRPFGPTGVKVTMTPASHSSELLWRNPVTNKDETHSGGEPSGFMIELENGFRIWHMGDTGVFGDMRLIGERYRPDLLLIPIGGGQFVMNPVDAAMVTREFIKPRMAWPMHYATNPALVGTPAEYIQALGTSTTRVLNANPGDSMDF
jgi:L-ascorbate metabolism protein UlaG (beta-lactamase superfamily)